MTSVSHGAPSAIAAAQSTTTPAATSRADTSLTGSGKENSERIDPIPIDIS